MRILNGVQVLFWILFVTTITNASAESCTYDEARAPVNIYTKAMKEFRFDDAFAVLTENMTDGLASDDWSAGQRKMFKLGQVVIGDLDVRWPQHVDPASCTTRALVPSVLSAKDVFNNQGSVEFELYTVVKVGDSWKIDSQETLIDDKDVPRWFPGDAIPEFKGQLPREDAMPGDDDY